MEQPSLRVAVACNVRITNRIPSNVRYVVNGNGEQGILYPNRSATITLLNENVNQISFNQQVAIYTSSGNVVNRSTSSLTIRGCNDNYQLMEPRQFPIPQPQPQPFPFPFPQPQPFYPSNCSNDPQLQYIANAIRFQTLPESQLVSLVYNLSASQINTLICIPSIDNAYLLELAVINQLPNLVNALISGGANPCLTSDRSGRSIYSQLLQIGSNAATIQQQQIIGILAQSGGANC